MPDSATAEFQRQPATSPPQRTNESWSSLFLIAVWFGVITGITEGFGLLLFQRINWQRWGPMVHVSREIIWISPLVDTLLFVIIALLVALSARVAPRISALRVLAFGLVFLAIYDWLTLTERLYHRACLLLALGVAVAFNRWLVDHRDRVLLFWRKSLVWLLAAWLIIFGSMEVAKALRERRELAALPPADANAPNILLIVIDTLRADHLSSYGYARTTPNLDRLAREGILFQNAISACSWTLPSHASLVTGRYPSDHGMGNAQPMPWRGWGSTSLRGYPTLGEALERHGYRTGAFSANQSYFTSNVGLGRGFIHFEDYFQSPRDMLLRTLFGREFDRVYLHRTARSWVTRSLRWLGLAGLLDNRKRADEVNREAMAWIDRRPGPFFAFLNYIDVHDASVLPWISSSPAWGLDNPVNRYDSALDYVDSEIGKLMQQLDQRGVARNTLVIVTGDHGESLGQHDMQFHGIALYREQIQVPLLLWYPSHIPTGLKITRPVSNAAIAATIMDFAGAGGQKIFPGVGLKPFWTELDRDSPSPGPISELARNEIVIDPDRQARNVEPTAMDGDMKSLVTARWHLIVHQKMRSQLFDWVHDPGEIHNLIDSPEGQSAIRDLMLQIQNETSP